MGKNCKAIDVPYLMTIMIIVSSSCKPSAIYIGECGGKFKVVDHLGN